MDTQTTFNKPILVPGGTGKTGRRIVERLLDYLFSTVLDGRNASLADGVQRALGRPPRDFAHYAREAAHAGAWEIAA